MFDASIRPLIDPALNRLGRALARRGVSADGLTLVGCAFGLASATAIGMGRFNLALTSFLIGRLFDGLDGAVARATAKTDRGGFLDIVLDFAVYAAIPLAFAVHDPAANAVAAACLLAAIIVNGTSFLAFAIMAERRQLTTNTQGGKSLYYLAGIAEGTETILVFVAFLLLPGWFAVLSFGFAGLCAVSALARIVMAWQLLRPVPAATAAPRRD
jgi:phosphatidylglycerophosphate synthase